MNEVVNHIINKLLLFINVFSSSFVEGLNEVRQRRRYSTQLPRYRCRTSGTLKESRTLMGNCFHTNEINKFNTIR